MSEALALIGARWHDLSALKAGDRVERYCACCDAPHEFLVTERGEDDVWIGRAYCPDSTVEWTQYLDRDYPV